MKYMKNEKKKIFLKETLKNTPLKSKKSFLFSTKSTHY